MRDLVETDLFSLFPLSVSRYEVLLADEGLDLLSGRSRSEKTQLPTGRILMISEPY